MELSQGYHQFATVLEEAGDKWVVHVVGDIDLSCAAEFETAIDHAASFGAPVVVDFLDCSYMDSTALTALVRAVKRYGGRVEAVVRENSPIARIVRITRFNDVLPIDFVTTPNDGSARARTDAMPMPGERRLPPWSSDKP